MSVLYFVQMERSKLIKIGFASDLEQRLSAIQCGNPEPLIVLATAPGGQREEAEIHYALALSRLEGEWFVWSDALARIIDHAQSGWTGAEIVAELEAEELAAARADPELAQLLARIEATAE